MATLTEIYNEAEKKWQIVKALRPAAIRQPEDPAARAAYGLAVEAYDAECSRYGRTVLAIGAGPTSRFKEFHVVRSDKGKREGHHEA